ncbi:MAG TPA: NAD(+) synthase [Anaerolineae bacterium]|nr:NAD(+) synthase [Anaerolineae bacterium]
MKLSLGQINPCVGDLEGNVARCLEAAGMARRQGAGLLVLPEMAIPGYPPRDILYDPSFVSAASEAAADLARRARGGPPIVAGTIVPPGTTRPGHPGLYNAAVLLQDGEVRLVAAKRLLPAYDVYYEPRWFLPGPPLPPVEIAGRSIGFLVCEDLWDEGHALHPPAELLAAGAGLLVCLAASPYRRGVMAQRLHHARRHGAIVAYANLWGGQDELIFDGRSFIVDGEGRVVARLAAFAQEVRTVDLSPGAPLDPPDEELPPPGSAELELFQALVLGVRDFAGKNRLPHAFLGLSGGVDSAVVAVIAAEALGPERVTAVALPSRYTDPRSTTAARDLALALGIGFEIVGLEPLHAAAEAALGDLLQARAHAGRGDTAAENVQARLRALILMVYVNTRGGMLLNTSNKSELALGYSTLYGDMAGTLCPIADVGKPEVYSLARWINSTRGGIIPPFIVERPPSAELRPGQVDPFDYDEVAPLLEQLVAQNRSDPALRRSEHKRWQMGVVLKVSEKAFGTGRLIPITRR